MAIIHPDEAAAVIPVLGNVIAQDIVVYVQRCGSRVLIGQRAILSRKPPPKQPGLLHLARSKQLINIAKPSLLDLTQNTIPSAPPPLHLAPPLLSTPLCLSDSRSTFCGHVQAAHPPRVHSRRPFFRLPECPGSSFNSTQHNSPAAAHMAKTRLRDRDW